MALFVSDTGFTQNPRWQATLWVFLGAHFISLSTVHIGGLGIDTIQPFEVANAPEILHFVPVVMVALAAGYTCTQLNSTRIKHNISNAFSAGTGYFLAGLLAMVITDIQPSVTAILSIGLIVGAAIWLGSSFVGFFARGIPFIGIASLGTIAALGILLVMGGIAILSAVDTLVAISFGTAIIVGSMSGVSRRLDRRGQRANAEYTRVYGMKMLLEENWKEILIVVIVLVMLLVGVTNGNISEIQ